MSLLALGLNHKSAPVAIRERAAFNNDALEEPLHDLLRIQGVREAAIVSTCNRTEIYCGLDKHSENEIKRWFHDFHSVAPDLFTPYLFRHDNHDAVRHLLRVSSGLDSLVLGEPQILGQIKKAYQEAQHNGAMGKELGQLFRHAFTVAKQIRTDTAIGSSPVSVAFAAVSLAKQIFGELHQQTALMIGAGETIELAVRHLNTNNVGNIIIANRTLERAQNLAQTCGGSAITIADIPNVLPQADIIISSTASPLPLLGKGAVEAALKVRKHRPMFMVDIAVPRDIEEQVGELDDVFLYTVDHLHDIIQEGHNSRKQAAEQAEEIVERQVEEFMRWMRSLDAMGTIKAYRQEAMSVQAELLQKAQTALTNGQAPDKVIQQLAHQLTNRLLHTPSSRIREAGAEGNQDLIKHAQHLFGLNREEL